MPVDGISRREVVGRSRHRLAQTASSQSSRSRSTSRSTIATGCASGGGDLARPWLAVGSGPKPPSASTSRRTATSEGRTACRSRAWRSPSGRYPECASSMRCVQPQRPAASFELGPDQIEAVLLAAGHVAHSNQRHAATLAIDRLIVLDIGRSPERIDPGRHMPSIGISNRGGSRTAEIKHQPRWGFDGRRDGGGADSPLPW